MSLPVTLLNRLPTRKLAAGNCSCSCACSFPEVWNKIQHLKTPTVKCNIVTGSWLNIFSAQLQAATDRYHHTMMTASREERLDSCKRAIHRLQERVDRLRQVINRDALDILFRLNELRSNLDRVLARLDMEWEDFQPSYCHDPDISSFSTDSD